MPDVTLLSTGLSAGGIGTIVERIVSEIHRAGDDDYDAIKRAVITAMEWFRVDHFSFNEGTHKWTMTIGQETYGPETDEDAGYPADLVSPINLYVKVGGTRWLVVDQVGINEQRWLQPTDSVTGIIDSWAWHNELIYVTPWPSYDNLELRMDYVKDVGIPRYVWVGTEWKFFLPGSNADLPDTFTNRWIEDAEELIRMRAKQDLYFNYYDDAENAMKMGNAVQAVLGRQRRASSNFQAQSRRKATRV